MAEFFYTIRYFAVYDYFNGGNVPYHVPSAEKARERDKADAE